MVYLLRYQAKQINLCYSLIKRMMEYRASLDGADTLIRNAGGQLHVIDIGCGALAMQFGVALAAADEIERGRRVTRVVVTSRDRSRAMRLLGWNMWRQFRLAVNSDSALSSLKDATQRMEPTRFLSVSDPFPRTPEGADCWVSAIHALYDDSSSDINLCFQRVFQQNPNCNVSLVTTHDAKRILMAGMTPAGMDTIEIDHPYEETNDIPNRTGLPMTRNWWRAQQQNLGLLDDDDAQSLVRAIGYWDWKDAVCRISVNRNANRSTRWKPE